MNQLYNEIDRRMEIVAERVADVSEDVVEDFYRRLEFSWIYHDNALEGLVLSYHELNAAIDDAIISDSSLIPAYADIVNQQKAIHFVRASAAKKKGALGLDFLKKLSLLLGQEKKKRGKAAAKPQGQYRKDNPLHRLYFHEIAPPDKISYQMRKLVQWLASDEAKKMHPVRRAAHAHHKLITIFPWPRHSGKIARLLMNAMLQRDGLLPSIIHAVERQRYYEVLRQPPDGLTRLVGESLTGTLDAAARFFEAGGDPSALLAAS